MIEFAAVTVVAVMEDRGWRMVVMGIYLPFLGKNGPKFLLYYCRVNLVLLCNPVAVEAIAC